MNGNLNENIIDLEKVNTENFSSNNLFKKIAKVFKLAGKGIIEKVFLLFALLKDDNIPGHTKLTVISGLSYFILPFDAIPDFLIGIGFTDDLSVLLGILYLLSSSITQEHKDYATSMTAKYFD